jgi:hypothetical protein
MDAGPKTLAKLFESSQQIFRIPTFQRAYVWKQDKQWEPLWEDIRNLAEQFGELLSEGKGMREAQKAAGRHFMGAVVVQRIDRPFGEPETWELIDGQQRITTLQLVLDATRTVFEEHNLTSQAQSLRSATRNTNHFCTGDDVYKIWPTGSDQDAFRAVMEGKGADHEHSRIAGAHKFFRQTVGEWLTTDGADPAQRAHHLLVTLLALLELVVIKLDGSDDAFVVFETMNARGTPLLAAELVKNFVLQVASKQGHDKDEFHEAHWKHFEEFRPSGQGGPWWMEEIRQGRIYRSRIDVFLNHWLVMRTGSEVKSRALFSEFQKLVAAKGKDDIVPIIDDFNHIAEAYRGLGGWAETTPEGRFLRRWRIVQAGVLTPVLLQLFAARPGELPVERRQRALAHLESFLVRRLACRLTTKDYNRLFLELTSKLAESITNADETIRAFLLSQTADSRAWPTDDMVQQYIVNQPLYGRINQARIRMILEGIEIALRSDKAETLTVSKKLQLEHVMPRSWGAHWPLPPHDPEDRVQVVGRRNRLIHTLGNLTLLTGKLNKSVSNSAWGTKRAAVDAHTTLFLNKRLLDNHPADDEGNGFDEDSILARSERLAAVACQVWPRPEPDPAA